MTEYRIEFSLQRRKESDADFTEIGFGTSGTWGSPAQCVHMIGSDFDHGQWETSEGMPDPDDVMDEVRAEEEAR